MKRAIMQPFRELNHHACLLLPIPTKVFDQQVILPTGTTLGRAGVATICSILRTVVEGN